MGGVSAKLVVLASHAVAALLVFFVNHRVEQIIAFELADILSGNTVKKPLPAPLFLNRKNPGGGSAAALVFAAGAKHHFVWLPAAVDIFVDIHHICRSVHLQPVAAPCGGSAVSCRDARDRQSHRHYYQC